MKCFDCGSNCLTVYCIKVCFCHKELFRWVVSPGPLDNIIEVRKDCMNCEWHSHPTKIPGAIE